MDNTIFDALPDSLTAQHIADHLGRSRRRVYDLFNLNPLHGGIKNFSMTNSPKSARMVQKTDFIAWIEARKRERESRFAKA